MVIAKENIIAKHLHVEADGAKNKGKFSVFRKNLSTCNYYYAVRIR